MNTIFKFNPLTCHKFAQIVFKSNKSNAKNSNIKYIQSNHFPTNIVMLSTALAFTLWPVKKKVEPEKPSTELKNPVIVDDADKLFENGYYEECYNLLTECEDSENVEIQWRICRTLYNMSKESKYDKQYKKSLVLQAYDIIVKLLEKTKDHYAVHKWYALILDAKSTYGGTKERIRQLDTVKKHMDLAVSLNPNDATILHMLGEWCYQITEMPWHHRKIAEVLFATPPYSSYEEALEYFLKAESVQPRFYSVNLLRLGDCYLKLQKEDQAKYYLQLAASYPAKSNDDHLANTAAAELLKKLK
ncbi:unnamed protein product [Chrysodeixis includens]|uniref:Regulator of microtubule dynamics protein 1 n=1 Tax=Chrysodeixis includens TaxID=689277 RepID=A0A9P0BSB2_CHRIL|nr:unnamed protein product [Chrysodeixis includens]